MEPGTDAQFTPISNSNGIFHGEIVPKLGQTMQPVNRMRLLAFLVPLVAALLLSGSAAAVLVDFPAEGIQLKEGCSGDTAEFCDLRIY